MLQSLSSILESDNSVDKIVVIVGQGHLHGLVQLMEKDGYGLIDVNHSVQ